MATHSLTLIQIKARPPTLIAPPFSKGPVRVFTNEALIGGLPNIDIAMMSVVYSFSAAALSTSPSDVPQSPRVRDPFGGLLSHARTLLPAGFTTKQKKPDEEET